MPARELNDLEKRVFDPLSYQSHPEYRVVQESTMLLSNYPGINQQVLDGIRTAVIDKVRETYLDNLERNNDEYTSFHNIPYQFGITAATEYLKRSGIKDPEAIQEATTIAISLLGIIRFLGKEQFGNGF